MKIIRVDVNYEEKMAQATELVENFINPTLSALCLVTGYTMGNSNEYLSSIPILESADKLSYGQSVCVFSRTGSGKTNTIVSLALAMYDHEKTIILTNRTACKTQLLKELIKKLKGREVPEEYLDLFSNENIKVLTYQQFARQRNKYNKKKLLLICDECHCFAEDSAFSVYPQQVTNFLKMNRDYLKIIYMTATPNDIISVVWDIEKVSNTELRPLEIGKTDEFLKNIPTKSSTRIQHIYLMKSDWDYITFKTYRPDKMEQLIDYINKSCSEKNKTLIFINDKEIGKSIQEKLSNCQYIYSDDDKKSEIAEIALNEKFDADALTTTKVLGNGVSLKDDNLSVVVAQTFDPVTIQQFIGRIRVNIRNPREITVLIPDYTLSHLGTFEARIYRQLMEFERVKKEPNFSMENISQPNPYIYYDAILKEPVINYIGFKQLNSQLEYVKDLKAEEQETPHAHIRRILSLYNKSVDNIEELRIDYDNVKDCKERISSAWEKYKDSEKGQEALKILKDELSSACNETNGYPKEIKTNVQIPTINDILHFADINEELMPERKVYDIKQTG